MRSSLGCGLLTGQMVERLGSTSSPTSAPATGGRGGGGGGGVECRWDQWDGMSSPAPPQQHLSLTLPHPLLLQPHCSMWCAAATCHGSVLPCSADMLCCHAVQRSPVPTSSTSTGCSASPPKSSEMYLPHTTSRSDGSFGSHSARKAVRSGGGVGGGGGRGAWRQRRQTRVGEDRPAVEAGGQAGGRLAGGRQARKLTAVEVLAVHNLTIGRLHVARGGTLAVRWKGTAERRVPASVLLPVMFLLASLACCAE